MTTLKEFKSDSCSTKECVQKRIKKLIRVSKALSIVENFSLEMSSNLKTRLRVVFILIAKLVRSIRPSVEQELKFWKSLKF